jgi:hypothetical protein
MSTLVGKSEHNGPGIEAIDKVKALILGQCVKELQDEDAVKEQYRCNSTEQERTGQKLCLLSGLENVIFNDFIKNDFIQEGDGQVASGSTSLPDPVA